MPALIDMIPPDEYDQGKHGRAQEFWANASAYATQAAPYGVERMQQLDQQAGEIQMGMQFVPPQVQQKIMTKLRAELLDPVEGDTAQEYDAAWAKLQQITSALHKDLMPSMQQMSGLAGPMNQDPMMDQGVTDMAQEEMPTGPHMMPDGTMMGAY